MVPRFPCFSAADAVICHCCPPEALRGWGLPRHSTGAAQRWSREGSCSPQQRGHSRVQPWGEKLGVVGVQQSPEWDAWAALCQGTLLWVSGFGSPKCLAPKKVPGPTLSLCPGVGLGSHSTADPRAGDRRLLSHGRQDKHSTPRPPRIASSPAGIATPQPPVQNLRLQSPPSLLMLSFLPPTRAAGRGGTELSPSWGGASRPLQGSLRVPRASPPLLPLQSLPPALSHATLLLLLGPRKV